MTSISRSTSRSKTDSLLRHTRIHFPRLDDSEVQITAIEKGGSDRKFYRVRCVPDHAIILVKYNLEREENRHYVQIAEFLAAQDIRAPKIYHHDPAEGLIWIEDLGETDLWSFRDESWLVRRAHYESALDEIAKLHCLLESAAESIREDLPAEFNAALYSWEQSYFFENCLERHFGFANEQLADLRSLTALAEIAERLSARPRALVHRDFQSQNIIIRDQVAHLIDFQGMRPGLPEYDIASLLYDPYVAISGSECAELFDYYQERRAKLDTPLAADSREIFRLCAMQRLMQALGAYGFLGHVKGNRAFLAHIPAALRSLHELAGKTPGLESLHLALAPHC